MKKLVLTGFVGAVFILYSFFSRNQNSHLIIAPSSISQNTPSNNNQTNSGSSSGSSTTNPQYNNGSYTGSIENAYYGNVQVSVTISGGKITAVQFLQYPNTHSTSVYINQQAMPYLQQEAIQAQNANVNIITGATFTSQAFIQSLSNALSRATKG